MKTQTKPETDLMRRRRRTAVAGQCRHGQGQEHYAVAKARQLRTLEAQQQEYRRRIEELFASHADSGMFGSLPTAGAKIAPRIFSEVGSDRALDEDAQVRQCVAGTAPVSYQSGKISKVHMHRACNKNLRHAMDLFADKKPRTEHLGGHFLRHSAKERQEPCPGTAQPGTKVDENHLEDVADAHFLRRGTAPEKPDRARLLGLSNSNLLTDTVDAKNFSKKTD